VLAVHCGEFGFNVTYRRSEPIQCVLKASNPHCVQSNIITAERQTVAQTSSPDESPTQRSREDGFSGLIDV
jgi:hypothetical protein